MLAAVAGIYWVISSRAATECSQNVTTSNFASAFSSAGAGTVLCLAAGNYGSFNGGAKSGMVTIQPQAGAAVTMSGGTFGSSVRNVTIQGVTFTGPVEVNPGSTPMNLIFDGDTWGNVGQGTHEGRLSIVDGGLATGNGVQIKNSTFGPGGCSDGIQDSSRGTEIGPNNEFKEIVQNCSANDAHVDPIQAYASNDVYIHDNYLHDNEQGIMSPDGVSTGYRIENNVIHTATDYTCMHLGDTRNGTVKHNVCRNGSIRVYGGNQNVPSQNMVVQNNAASMDVSDCTGCTVDHNQTVTFTGGSGRCAYATASPKATGSDGTDIGLNNCSGGSTPSPTPPPPAPTPTPPPPPPSPTPPSPPSFSCSGSAATICADFATNANGFTTSGGTWTASGGKYSLSGAQEVAGNIGLDNRAIHSTTVNGGFTLTVDASVAASSSSFDDFGVIFNYQDANNYYVANFNETDDAGGNGIIRVQGGAETKLATLTGSTAGGTTYAVKVVKTGSTIKVYRDNVLVATATDATFTGGKIGVGSSNDSAQFDNVVVVASSSTPAPAPTPPPTTKQGDINSDNAVNIFDLSVLLSNYGKTRSAASNPMADINNNNAVDIFDLSILLSKYGT